MKVMFLIDVDSYLVIIVDLHRCEDYVKAVLYATIGV